MADDKKTSQGTRYGHIHQTGTGSTCSEMARDWQRRKLEELRNQFPGVEFAVVSAKPEDPASQIPRSGDAAPHVARDAKLAEAITAANNDGIRHEKNARSAGQTGCRDTRFVVTRNPATW